jgi:predicted patatin/cPLA2 family phospholipase
MKKAILLLCGGGMAGIFGAGVVSTLEDLGAYDKFEAIYGISAGAINAAYFLTRQTKLGSSIYYEDLTHDFIHKNHILHGSYQRFYNRYIKKLRQDEIKNSIDIDHLFYIIKDKKKLDIDRLRKDKIRFYARVLNVKTHHIETLNVKDNPLDILKAATSAVPHYCHPQNIGGKDYVDAAIKDPIGIKYLLEKYFDRKIVVVINYNPTYSFIDWIKDFIEGSVAKPMFEPSLFRLYISRKRLIEEELKLIKSNKNILLIEASKDSPTSQYTTDTMKLMKTYNMGLIAGKSILPFLNH